MTAAAVEAAHLAGHVHRSRFRYASEVELHEGIAQALAAAGYDFEREVRLDGRSRIDFLVDGAEHSVKIGLEVKVAGSVGQVARQLVRYAEHVDALVLVTTRAVHAHVPGTIGGKPCVGALVRSSAW